MQIKIDKESICWSTLDSETLLLNLDSGYYYTLDAFSGLVWGMLVDGCDEEGIAPCVASAYGLEKLDVISDIKAFIAELAMEGLLTVDINIQSQVLPSSDRVRGLTEEIPYSRPCLVKHERLYELGIGT
jgi:hypothetical protein